jgi:hypothetical protein
MMVGSAGMRGAFASQYTAGDRPFGAQLLEPLEPIDPPEFAPKKSLPDALGGRGGSGHLAPH